MKTLPSGDWQRIDQIIDLELKEESYELSFRVVNLSNVSGLQHKVVIDSK